MDQNIGKRIRVTCGPLKNYEGLITLVKNMTVTFVREADGQTYRVEAVKCCFIEDRVMNRTRAQITKRKARSLTKRKKQEALKKNAGREAAYQRRHQK